MLTDLWLIAQLLLQICSLFLLSYACVYAIIIVRKWRIDEVDETQLLLERQSYLVGTLAQVVLFFQLLGLIFFVFTTNSHLPTLIKGAMCAAGVLEANEFGTPLLYLKISSIFIYITFLIYQYLDNLEPAYPLTPKKYFWLFPSFVLLLADFFLQISFYYHINPDKIVACCSLSFVGESSKANIFIENQQLTYITLTIWIILFVIHVAYLVAVAAGFSPQAYVKNDILRTKVRSYNNIYSNIYFEICVGVCYIGFSIWTLQHFFVKYIYGIPTHACLHDLFLGHYYGIGFLLFGIYYGIAMALIFKLVLKKQQQNLVYGNYQNKIKFANKLIMVFLWLSLLIPCWFWFKWNGNL